MRALHIVRYIKDNTIASIDIAHINEDKYNKEHKGYNELGKYSYYIKIDRLITDECLKKELKYYIRDYK